MNLANLSKSLPAVVFGQLGTVVSNYGINTEYRMAHFLGQCAEESEDFKVVEENLNYTAAELVAMWPHLFTTANAGTFAHKPEEIANLVYCNRMGNGTRQCGDGWLFKGRGYIQLTGKSEYQRFSTFIKDTAIMATPDLIATKYALEAAAWYFKPIVKYADLGMNQAAFEKVTKAVNGGETGLAQRIKYTQTFYNLLTK